jgi:uncharacterized membrane protein YbhN (UPF0104 family)
MTSPRESRSGHWLKAVFLLAVILGAVWWFRTRSFDWTDFWRSLAGLNPVWVAMSCVASLLTYPGRAIRWQVFIEHSRPQAKFAPLLEATVIGFSFSVILGRAGEFVRPFLIARSQQLTVSSQIAVWFLERLSDLIAVLLLFGFVLTRFDMSQANRAGPEVRWVLEYGGRAIGALGGISLVILLAFRAFSAKAAARLTGALSIFPEPWRERLEKAVVSFAGGVESTRKATVLARIGLYTMLEWFLIAISFYWLLQSSPFTRHLSFLDTLVVLGFVSFASVLQIPGVGGGAQIVSVLVLHQLFDVAIEPATAMAMLMWAVGFALVTPAGLLWAARSGLGFRQIAAAAQEAETRTPDSPSKK